MMCTDLMESSISVRSGWQASQTGRDVPETHITVLWLFEGGKGTDHVCSFQ